MWAVQKTRRGDEQTDCLALHPEWGILYKHRLTIMEEETPPLTDQTWLTTLHPAWPFENRQPKMWLLICTEAIGWMLDWPADWEVTRPRFVLAWIIKGQLLGFYGHCIEWPLQTFLYERESRRQCFSINGLLLISDEIDMNSHLPRKF